MWNWGFFLTILHNPLLSLVFVLGFLLFKKTPYGNMLLQKTVHMIGIREQQSEQKIKQAEHELRMATKEHDQIERLKDIQYEHDIKRFERHQKREEELEVANHHTQMEQAASQLDGVLKSRELYDAAVADRLERKDYEGVLFITAPNGQTKTLYTEAYKKRQEYAVNNIPPSYADQYQAMLAQSLNGMGGSATRPLAPNLTSMRVE